MTCDYVFHIIEYYKHSSKAIENHYFSVPIIIIQKYNYK